MVQVKLLIQKHKCRVQIRTTHKAKTYKIKQETSRPKTQTMTDSAHMFVVLMTHEFTHCMLCGFMTQSHYCHWTGDLFVLKHRFTEFLKSFFVFMVSLFTHQKLDSPNYYTQAIFSFVKGYYSLYVQSSTLKNRVSYMTLIHFLLYLLICEEGQSFLG